MTPLDGVAKGAYPDFGKGLIAMKSWLVGKHYPLSLQAMNITKRVHTGLRKDGETPAFQHQMGVTYYLRTIHSLLFEPDITIAAGFLHDSPEDGLIRQMDVDSLGSASLSVSVSLLNKSGLSNSDYYRGIAGDRSASIVKGADRMNNLQSMIEVFSEKKQKEYVTETTDFVLPMLKEAQEEFAGQWDAYENVRHILKCQVDLIVRINGWS